jgi:GNAT superfamily N-acetyltransferase
MTYRIREVDGLDDEVIETLDELHDACFEGNAPRVQYDTGHWWLAYYGRQPVAFSGIIPSTLGVGIGYFNRVGVLPQYRGRGLQRRLMRCLEACARRNGWVAVITDTTDNVPSANNMIKAGYKLFDPPYGRWAFEHSNYWMKELV